MPSADPSFVFTRAITRRPPASAINGLRDVDRGAPDIDRLRADHAAYVETLKDAGVDVIELPPLEAYPDSLFVEDVALCLPQGAIVLRPAAPSRAGEAEQMVPHLKRAFAQVAGLDGPGTIEGGDILVTAREILVGLSARTTREGAQALARVAAPWGHQVRIVKTPPEVLHFKTACGLLDGATVLATPRLAATGCFEGYRVLPTAPEEEAAANVIRVNGLVIMPAGFPETAARIRKAGYELREVPNEQAALLDGGMSCLSLRF